MQNELLLKRGKIRNLIKHPMLLGFFYERIIRDAIRKLIPSKYSLEMGFIMYDGVPSKQIDLILYDNTKAFLDFNENDIIMIQPEGVIAVIEIKSTFGSNELTDAKINFSSARKLFHKSQPHPKVCKKLFAIFIGYQSMLSDKKIQDELQSFDMDCYYFSKKTSTNEDGYILVSGQMEKLMDQIRWILKYSQTGSWTHEQLVKGGYFLNPDRQ